MTPERWRQIKEVLAAAVPLGDHERASYLAAVCGDDAELRGEVGSLLAARELAGTGFLEMPALRSRVAADVLNTDPSTLVGHRIGAYDIVAEIGCGGMGEVFAAVRADGQYEQKVALKLVRAGLDTAGIVERFRGERQILAGLDHPYIARLFDGGTTDSGVPYLVMELVDGTRIDEFCRAHRLSVAGRLQLFLRVCSAVQYAHQHLVVHRDIKPANILVTGDGIPKLLDFGIATLLDPVGSVEETMLRPFTPEYASPEQIRGEPVSTATDVYALGVVLYRLLTGRAPYRLESRTSAELAAAITSQEPERPSAAVLRREGDASVEPMPSPRVRRQLRGDLDLILLKALRKEPERRYASVEQFAEDIRRHLDGLPVIAQRGTWRYQAGKFVRRHRTVVAAAALVLSTLVGGIVVTAREARIAEANRRRAEARFNDLRKLANSLIFEVHDSIQDLPGTTDARRLILQRSLEYLNSLARESGNEPDLVRELATAYSRIGIVQGNPSFINLGDTKAALASFQKAIEMRERLARSDSHNRRDQVELAVAYLDYADFQRGAGSVSVGFEYAQRALATLERESQPAPDDLRILKQSMRAHMILGELQVGEGLSGSVGRTSAGVADLQKALRLADRAVELSPSDPGNVTRQAHVEIILGDAFLKLGDRPSSLLQYQRALDLLDPIVQRGDNLVASFNAAVVNGKIGDVWLIEGKTSQAVPCYAEALRRLSRLAAAEPHNESLQREEAIKLVSLGHALLESGQTEEGLRYARQALAKIEADSTSTPLVRSTEVLIRGWLGEGLERQGKIREASHEYAVSRELIGAVRAGGADDRRMRGYFAAATDRHAATLVKLGDIDTAMREYEESRNLLEPVVQANPEDHELAYVLVETYTAEGTIAAARARRARDRAEQLADWQAASAWFRKSLSTWSTVPHPTRISSSGFEVTLPADVSDRLARCDREITSLGGSSHGRQSTIP
jgi:tetratricopeptide (TPR) repeat protein